MNGYNILRRLHRKGPMATKLIIQTSTHLTTTCGVTCDASKCTAANLGWLATDNGQQSYQRLSHMSEVLNACVSADGGHFEHMMW